jgi:bifunctional N-acetylglucosamine-1-phosphate-uridyltransferase/glucosamine-1-phosphate-acetyltransferase GlmU-like protein
VVASFVETKNLVAGTGAVIPPLTYLGDTTIEGRTTGATGESL